VVLLHGAGDQAGTWADVVPPLLDEHHLVIPDLPGHGDSDPAEGSLGVGTVLEGIEAVLERRTSGPVTVVGNSLGGWIAMLLAAGGEHPIERLVLVNGGALRGEGRVNLMPADRAEARELMARMRSPESPELPGFVLDDVVRVARTGPIARLSQTADEMGSYLLDGRLDSVQVPVDLLWGADDQVMPLRYARRLEEGLAAVRLTTLPDCGHVPQRECPADFAGALARVLAQPPPAPTAAVTESVETP
jgi:pimeloyl-ACP methyl ester carboxylesterase